jgi:hypothetical protein
VIIVDSRKSTAAVQVTAAVGCAFDFVSRIVDVIFLGGLVAESVNFGA